MLSGETHDDRSNSMNSSAFSWGERSLSLHSPGMAPLVSPERERDAWEGLLAELSVGAPPPGAV